MSFYLNFRSVKGCQNRRVLTLNTRDKYKFISCKRTFLRNISYAFMIKSDTMNESKQYAFFQFINICLIMKIYLDP